MKLEINPSDTILVEKYAKLNAKQKDYAKRLVEKEYISANIAIDYAATLKFDCDGNPIQKKLRFMVKNHGCSSFWELYDYVKKYKSLSRIDQLTAYALYFDYKSTFKEVMDYFDEDTTHNDIEITYIGDYYLFEPNSNKYDEDSLEKLGLDLVYEGYFFTDNIPDYMKDYLNYVKIARDMMFSDDLCYCTDPDFDFSTGWLCYKNERLQSVFYVQF